MLSIVLEAPHRLALREVAAPPAPGPGQALVRVLRVGVCGTDLHAYRGEQALMRYPVVLGHELAVEVVALGDPEAEARPRVGDLCTVVPYLHDGTCDACRRGLTNCCETLSVLGVHQDGGMTESLLLPADLLVPAGGLHPDAVALVEMLAIGAHATRRAAPTADDDVLVLGAGPIGLSVLAFARARARRALAVDLAPHRLALVRSLGLADTLEGGDDLAERLRERLDGRLPTVVIDATGSAASMGGAPALAAHGGRVILVGHTKGELRFHNPTVHTRELELRSSRNATRSDFDTVLRALRDGSVDPLPWITTRAGPEALVRDLPAWSRGEGGVVKAVLEMA